MPFPVAHRVDAAGQLREAGREERPGVFLPALSTGRAAMILRVRSRATKRQSLLSVVCTAAVPLGKNPLGQHWNRCRFGLAARDIRQA